MSLRPNNNPDFIDVLKALKTDIFKSLNCVKVGKIISYDKSTQTAQIQIMHKKKNPYNETLVDYPLLESVPVIQLGGGSYLNIPIKQGDGCIVFFNDFMIDEWYLTDSEQSSTYNRRHDMSDGFAIVGVRNLITQLKNLSDFVELHYSESSYIIVGDTIELHNENVNASGKITGECHSTNGWSGSFGIVSGQTVTVVDGIITNVS